MHMERDGRHRIRFDDRIHDDWCHESLDDTHRTHEWYELHALREMQRSDRKYFRGFFIHIQCCFCSDATATGYSASTSR